MKMDRYKVSPDWLIEIRSPDQSTLDIQQIYNTKSCTAKQQTLLGSLIFSESKSGVWENKELPLVYVDNDTLPTLDNISELTVATVIAMTMTQQQ
jgi:Uma2 family endonuclease